MIRRQTENIFQIVFITGYSEYIAQGYEVAVLHYLIKPIKEDKLFEILNRAMEKVSKNEKSLNLEVSGSCVKVRFTKNNGGSCRKKNPTLNFQSRLHRTSL